MRSLFVLLALVAAGAVLAGPAPRVVQAQEEGAATEGGGEEKKAEGGHQHESTFRWFIRSSGLIGLFILILSIYFVALVIRLFMELRPAVLMPPEIVAKADELLQQRDFKGVYNLTREDDSFYSRVVSTGIAEMPNGLADAREAMQHVAEVETAEMEKSISMLAVLGTLGPMIGLLGTLKGMIASFSVIATSDTQLKASEVADGISEALLLTFEGVALSVPAIYFFAVFRNRVSTLSVSTMAAADQFLRHFAHTARSKAAPTAPQPAKAPTAPNPA